MKQPKQIAFLVDVDDTSDQRVTPEEGGLNASTTAQSTMEVLTIDVGARHVKILARGRKECREFEPGPKMTPKLKHDSTTNSLIRRYRKIRDTL